MTATPQRAAKAAVSSVEPSSTTTTATVPAAETLPGAADVVEDAGRISFTLPSDAVAASLSRLGALGVEGLRIAPPSLEELFLRHYGNPAGDRIER